MELRAAVLLFAVASLAGCDSFSPSDALVDLPDATTDPTVLVSEYGWAVVSAVSDGKAYQFPRGVQFYTAFGADGVVSGRVPNNGYAGDYVAAPGGTFRTGDVYRTLVGMSDRDAKLTRVLLSELEQATQFEVSGAALQIRSADGDGVRFERNGFRAQ